MATAQSTRLAEVDARLTTLRNELEPLELDAYDKTLDGTPAARTVHHGPAGAAEGITINALRDEIETLERERQALTGDRQS